MKRIILIIVVAIAIVAAWLCGLRDCIRLEWFKQESAVLQQMVAEQYVQSALLFILIYIVSTLLFMPFVGLLTVAGGFFFGTFEGALYTNIGATIGSLGAFLLVRYLIGSHVQARYERQLAAFNRAMHEGQISYLLAVHFITIIPFPLVNLLAAMTRIPLWTFIWTTSVGILPGSIIYAFAGKQLTTIHSVHDIFSSNIIIAFVLLALLALLPLGLQLIKNYLRRRVSK